MASLDTWRTALLLAATLTTGLVAGTFALYAHTVMPGLRRTDDRTFVGALVLAVAAAAATLGEPAFGWLVAALLLYLFAFTAMVATNANR